MRRTNRDARDLARRMSQSRQALNRQPRQQRLFDPNSYSGTMPPTRTIFESKFQDAPFRVVTLNYEATIDGRRIYRRYFYAGTTDQSRAIALATNLPTRAIVFSGDETVFDNGKD